VYAFARNAGFDRCARERSDERLRQARPTGFGEAIVDVEKEKTVGSGEHKTDSVSTTKYLGSGACSLMVGMNVVVVCIGYDPCVPVGRALCPLVLGGVPLQLVDDESTKLGKRGQRPARR